MISFPVESYPFIIAIASVWLIVRGIGMLLYYFTMARYMVGGIYIFYKGVLLLDAGLFALNMDDVPRQYAMIYLIITMGFSGLLAVVHSIESKRLQSGRWIHQFFYGSVEIISAIVCLFFLNSQFAGTSLLRYQFNSCMSDDVFYKIKKNY